MGHAIVLPHQHIVKPKPFFMTRTLFIIFLLATFGASFAHAQQDITMDSIIRTIQDNDVHTKVKKDSVPPKRIRVNGFRVQVYYGGNNQKSKLQARQMAQRVKIWFEDLSVYTTFSSPHWICRVGDFQTREEAMEVLTAMRESGKFPRAIIVKSKINITEDELRREEPTDSCARRDTAACCANTGVAGRGPVEGGVAEDSVARGESHD